MSFLLALVVVLTGAAHAAEQESHGHSGAHMVSPASPASPEAMIPSLAGATAWLNTAPISPQELRGKVVLIDFWTYTCINWRRTVPSLRAWVQRYGKSGLLLIGAHSPEFPFEKDMDNVRQFTRELGVTWPVAVDTDFSIWRAFGNEYWPALYVFDAKGRLRHQVFGEEGYPEAERVIRQLLEEAGQRDIGSRPVSVDPDPFEKPADWTDLRSPENYLGERRTVGFSSLGGIVSGAPHRYEVSPKLSLNRWALSGSWNVGPDRSVAAAAGAKLAYRFHARDVHLVMAPESRGSTIRFRVRLDGKPPGNAHGVDVDAEGNGTLKDQRMYQLIRQPGPIQDRTFEVEFLDPGAGAWSFTFG